MRQGCLKRIQTDCGKHTCILGLEFFFAKINAVHEVAAPYYPENTGMAEQLIWSLKERLHLAEKDQDLFL